MLLQKIRDESRRKGLKQYQLAAQADIAQGSLCRIFDRGNTDLETAAKLAKAVGLRLALIPDNDYLADLSQGKLLDG